MLLLNNWPITQTSFQPDIPNVSSLKKKSLFTPNLSMHGNAVLCQPLMKICKYNLHFDLGQRCTVLDSPLYTPQISKTPGGGGGGKVLGHQSHRICGSDDTGSIAHINTRIACSSGEYATTGRLSTTGRDRRVRSLEDSGGNCYCYPA